MRNEKMVYLIILWMVTVVCITLLKRKKNVISIIVSKSEKEKAALNPNILLGVFIEKNVEIIATINTARAGRAILEEVIARVFLFIVLTPTITNRIIFRRARRLTL
ncbi:MAG: hypothetical protein ACOCXT_03150 [Candidatus Dojkabacteria bacterium]